MCAVSRIALSRGHGTLPWCEGARKPGTPANGCAVRDRSLCATSCPARGSRRAARSSSRSTPRDRLRRRRRHPTRDYGVPAVEVLDTVDDAAPPDEELERLRILARTPRWGREIDDRVLPAEAGLDERAVCSRKAATRARSRSRGCTTAATRTAACACSSSRRRRRARRRGPLRGKLVGRVTSARATVPRPRLRPRRGARRGRAGRRRQPARGYTDASPPRARSSGDRALPCGGRGRKFESCRAHP